MIPPEAAEPQRKKESNCESVGVPCLADWRENQFFFVRRLVEKQWLFAAGVYNLTRVCFSMILRDAANLRDLMESSVW